MEDTTQVEMETIKHRLTNEKRWQHLGGEEGVSFTTIFSLAADPEERKMAFIEGVLRLLRKANVPMHQFMDSEDDGSYSFTVLRKNYDALQQSLSMGQTREAEQQN